jgi:predicted permease
MRTFADHGLESWRKPPLAVMAGASLRIMWLHVFSTLLPVFSILLLGFVLARTGFLRPLFVQEMNHLLFWVVLPAFIIGSLGRTAGFPAALLPLAGALGLSTVGLVVVAAGVLHWMDFPKRGRGTFLQAAFRGNLAFIAIPILIYAFRDRPSREVDAALGLAVVLFAPTMVLYNIISTLVLPLPQARDGRPIPPWYAVWLGISRNPLMIASVAGMILCLMPWKLPAAVLDTFDYLGRLAAPAALLCVGATMALKPPGRHWRPAAAAALLKVAVLPAAAFLMASIYQLGRTETLILMIFSASPSAAVSYVIAQKAGGDGELAASAIFISTALSIISLGVVIACFG